MDFNKFKGLKATEVNPDLPPKESATGMFLENRGILFGALQDVGGAVRQNFLYFLNSKGFGLEDLGFIKDPEKAKGIINSFRAYLNETDLPRKKEMGNKLAAEIKGAMEL